MEKVTIDCIGADGAAGLKDEAVAVFVTEGATEAGASASVLSDVEARAVARLLAAGVSRGKAKEVHFDLIEARAGAEGSATAKGAGAKQPGGGFRRVLVVGLGPADKVTGETLRQAGGALERAARKQGLGRVRVCLPDLHESEPPAPRSMAAAAAEAIAAGVLLASFDYEEYLGVVSRKRREEERNGGRRYFLTAPSDALGEAQRGVERGRIIAQAQNFARTIASRPGNDINPPSLAKVAREMADDAGLMCQVLDEKRMAELGMGGILAVGAGSSQTPPRMIVLEWKGGAARGKDQSSAAAPLMVVGKAITFDTGGISIKPAEKMGKMIFDKCGGMAVLGLMRAVAGLKLPIHVVGILASAENHVSDTAYRPGDILRMYNGVTVEVTNTDAEGRLVLADALAWGIETYKPAAVVDLATLTGGVIVALGKTMAGVMSNSDELVKELTDAGEAAGEKMWRLPLGDEQRDYIKSDPADIVNSGGREGHPLQGGAFLSYFVPWAAEKEGKGGNAEFIPWAHLDIAGVADTEKDLPYYRKGATGWGVRTLVEWVSSRVAPRIPHATPRAAGG